MTDKTEAPSAPKGRTMTPEKIEKIKRFANARPSARFCRIGPTPEDAVEGFYPHLSGELVNPQTGQCNCFDTAQQAVQAAKTYRQLCRDWLKENGHG